MADQEYKAFRDYVITTLVAQMLATEESSAIVQKKLPPKELGIREAKPTTISLQLATEESSAIVQKKLPPKELGFGEVKPTTISLQLVDKSIKYPRGLIEDVLVKVDKFIFPTDFIVLDMEENKEIHLILG
ncbi:hypothetical protein F2P56_026874 [Juglans regia]|uniref:Reverse transcriptase domain-containing protein n=2 Tax=Juglans regia TaxID=51240 RepID=A0A833U2I2_JUGRE|nr:uncharacterized protein LOC108999302 [Juglans regia]KAF5451804.1 hypothetical protein F2P56_026874 [Juglans regia]